MAGVNRTEPQAQTEQGEWEQSRGSCSGRGAGAVPAGLERSGLWPKRRAARLALLALFGLGLTGVTLAMPQFRMQAVVQLHYDKLDPLWQYSGKVMSCTFCHVNKSGGAPWNVFGQALKAGFAANPRSNFGTVLYTVLQANGDSDGDGYPDATEVYANTLPGDPQSHPDKPLAELEQQFTAAGGTAMYAPPKKGGK